MTWDTVPWFIGGGAQHSPEVGRLLAYAATSGSSGIVGVNDLLVRPLDVPAGKIRVSPGACVIPNRSTGGSQQTYIGRLPTEDVVDVASTGSGGGRIDLIVARVEDPYAAGTPWQDPADPTVGPYIFTRVIPNVTAAVVASSDAARRYLAGLGQSAIPLAAVTLPASTGTVTASMVKSLREMANPRRQRDLSTYALTPGDTETQTSTATAGEWWPNVGSVGLHEVPEWATRARIVVQWSQVLVPMGNAVGKLWVRLGSDAAQVNSDWVGYDTPSSGSQFRTTFVCGADLAVPAVYRGTNQLINPIAKLDQIISGGNTARLLMDNGSAIVLDVEWLEAPAEDDF